MLFFQLENKKLKKRHTQSVTKRKKQNGFGKMGDTMAQPHTHKHKRAHAPWAYILQPTPFL